MPSNTLEALVRETAGAFGARGWLLAAAESCTGGLISSSLTDLAGSSAWFLGGVVAYANSAKTRFLGVPEATLAAHGAVSREVVLAMASGARERFGAHAALAVSGVAGPDGGTPEKPVGTVWMAWDVSGTLGGRVFHFSGTRLEIKRLTAEAALSGLLERLGDGGR